LIIVFGILAATAVVVMGIFVARTTPAGAYDVLPVAQYVKTPRSLGGNTYIVDVRIDSQLAYKGEIGRVIAVRTQDEKVMLPVLVLKGHSAAFDPRVGQPYRFVVEVDEDGELILLETKKL